MKKDEILSVKSSLGNSKKRPPERRRQKNEFTLDDDSASIRLKTALVILPIVMILLVIGALIIGLNQFSSMFDSTMGESSTTSEQKKTDESKLLVVVSPESPLSSDFELALVPFESINVDEILVPDLENMLKAAKKDSMALKCEVGYVSPEQQHQLYNAEVERLMAEKNYGRSRAMEEAEKTVPAENHSEQQTGLCIVFSSVRSADFKSSDEYHWLITNGIKYGFVQRYPQGKEGSTGFEENPSLFRYVGRDNAMKLRTMDMCLDEYVRYLNSR